MHLSQKQLARLLRVDRSTISSYESSIRQPPVGVFFETDHLNTLGKDSELMLTFLASIAQEESVKKREAMVWSLA